jgi:hypothetical protein
MVKLQGRRYNLRSVAVCALTVNFRFGESCSAAWLRGGERQLGAHFDCCCNACECRVQNVTRPKDMTKKFTLDIG